MPLFRIGPKVVYFAHVPKCAGSAIETYLGKRFGPISFLDRAHFKTNQRWTRSSPQHAVWSDVRRLFHPGFFDHSFTVVRHPTLRLRSVYYWQREWEQSIAPDTTFETFLDLIARSRRKSSFGYDNHLRPMSQFVPKNCRFYKLENGLNPLVRWLDALAKNQEGPRKISFINTTEQRLDTRDISYAPCAISETAHARVLDLYNEDFERFEYSQEMKPLLEITP